MFCFLVSYGGPGSQKVCDRITFGCLAFFCSFYDAPSHASLSFLAPLCYRLMRDLLESKVGSATWSATLTSSWLPWTVEELGIEARGQHMQSLEGFPLHEKKTNCSSVQSNRTVISTGKCSD